MSAVRRLVLIRHATAEAPGPHGDAARELTTSGQAEARALGSWLKSAGLLGEGVICSPAVRTRQTWAAVVEATGHGVLIDMEPAVYEATPETLLGLVAETDALVHTLVVVGHAPGVPVLAADLCRGAGDTAAVDELNRGFAPASCAVVEFEGEWSELAPGWGTLVALRPGDVT